MPAIVKVAQAKQMATPKVKDNVELNYIEFEKQAAEKLSESQKNTLKKIGECESGFQMKANATGASSAYGIFQILKLHDRRAKSLGVSRLTREGNITVAINLFLEQGTNPWNASKHCWKK